MLKNVCKIPASELEKFKEEMTSIGNLIEEERPDPMTPGWYLVPVIKPDACPTCRRVF